MIASARRSTTICKRAAIGWPICSVPRANFDLVKLEIDRLENKIRSLSELAVNRQEPDYISGQVDQVAASMMETEKTMNELRFVTGLDSVDEAPSLLQNEISPPSGPNSSIRAAHEFPPPKHCRPGAKPLAVAATPLRSPRRQ